MDDPRNCPNQISSSYGRVRLGLSQGNSIIDGRTDQPADSAPADLLRELPQDWRVAYEDKIAVELERR